MWKRAGIWESFQEEETLGLRLEGRRSCLNEVEGKGCLCKERTWDPLKIERMNVSFLANIPQDVHIIVGET